MSLDEPHERHPVLRIGHPRLAVLLHSKTYDAYAPQPIPTGEAIAADAARLAGHGALFIVAATGAPISFLETARRGHVHSDTGTSGRFLSFLGALPTRFHPVMARTFPGWSPVTVYVYKG